MNRRIFILLLCICCLQNLTACSDSPADPQLSQTTEAPAEPNKVTDAGEMPTLQPSQTPPAAENDADNKTLTEPDNTQTPLPENSSDTEPSSGPMTDDEIRRRYAEAITALEQKVVLDITGREWKYGAEIDLKNIYYSLLSQHPELKYAYDMEATVSNGAAECGFSYMPYKTGAYSDSLPAGSHIIGSLHDAEVMAQSIIDGTESLSIAIFDPSLEVDDLQRAAGQAGYGWLSVSINRDATAIQAASFNGLTLQDCVEKINETFRIAGDILSEIVTKEMSDEEKVRAAYSYITENVAYDFRYYSARSDMPFESTVALGALRDNLAICGGYSHALETLLDMCGIENYTVSGTSKGEYHAWNYVILDGEGYYCDPTADRGGMSSHFLLTAQELEALGGYTWDADFYSKLRR